MPTTRRATPADLGSITEIYNEAILRTVATFDTEPKTVEQQRAWLAGHGTTHPVLVAQLENQIVGWASLSPWSDRCAYEDTAEISVYVKEEFRGEGIGKKLMGAVLAAGEKAGIHTVIARIADGNELSVGLHEAFGFQHIGVMREVGRKFDRLLDVHLMQKIFDHKSTEIVK